MINHILERWGNIMNARKNIISLAILFLLLSAVCASYIISVGGSYTYTLDNFVSSTNFSNIQVKFDVEGIVKVSEITDNSVEFVPLKSGDTEITIKADIPSDYTDSSIRYICVNLKLHVTSINTIICVYPLLNFNGYICINICTLIFIFAVLLVLLYSAKQLFKKTFYSYKNIVCVGLIIFVIFLLGIFCILLVYSLNYSELFSALDTISIITGSGQTISLMMLPIITLIFFLISISNISLIIHEGRSVRNILGVIIGFAFITSSFISVAVYLIFTVFGGDSPKSYISELIFGGFLSFIVLYFDCMFLSSCICALAAALRKPVYDKDYVIILGCGLKKDGTLMPLLKGRVDNAINFVKKQREMTGKNCIFVPSGGQGSDEVIAEADAMRNYLIENGIDDKNIIVENKSTTTLENMKFSKKIIDKLNPNAKVAFSTTNYHLFRSGMLAQSVDFNIHGIGSKTKWYFWPNAFLREFVGVIFSQKKYHLLAIAILFVVSLFFAIAHYIVYNF